MAISARARNAETGHDGCSRSGRGHREDRRSQMIQRGTVALLAALLAVPTMAALTPSAAHAAAPPPSGTIAFSSNFGGRVNVYTVKADGTDVTQVTDTLDARGPSWSPDGSSLSYAGGPDPSGVHILDVTGRNAHRVTDGTFMTAWSGEGSKLAFTRPGTDLFDIYTANVDGTAVQQVAAAAVSPAWSPDGKKLAFRRGPGIEVANADGSGAAPLTSSGDDHPSFSPDGTKIAFDSSRSGTRQIWLMNVDGSNQTAVTSSSSLQLSSPSWSPDGAALVVHTSDG